MKEKDEIKQMNEIINKIDIIKDEDWQQKEGETEEEYNRRIEEVENDMEEELLDYISDSLLSEQDIDEKEAIKEAEEKINKDYELFSDAFEKTSEGKIQLKSKEELEKLGYDSQEEYEKLLEIENNFNNPEQYFDKIRESIKKNKDLDSEIDRKMELAKAIISAKKRGEEYSPETYQKAHIGKFTKLNDYIADTAVLNRVPMIQEEFIRNNAIEENRYVSFVNNLHTGIATPNGTVITGINTMQAIQPIVLQMIPAKKKEVYTNLENKLGEDREQTKQKVLVRTELKKAFMEYSEKLKNNKDADITELTSKVLEIKNKFPNIVDIKLIEKIEKEFNVSIDKTAVEPKQGNSADSSQKHKYTRQEIEQTIQKYNNLNNEKKFQKGAIVAVLDRLKSYLEDNKDAEVEKYLHDILDEIDRIEPIDLINEWEGKKKKYHFFIVAYMRDLYKNGIKGVDGEILARDENKYAYYTYLCNRRIEEDKINDSRFDKVKEEYEQNAEDIELKYFLELGQNERDDGQKSHLKKQGTPTMGGIIMIIALLIMGGILYYSYGREEVESERVVATNLLPLLVATIGFGLIGFIDDFKKLVLNNTEGLKPKYKMIGLLIIATIFTVYLTNVMNIGTDIIIPFAKTTITLPIWIYIPFTILVMLATTNAINLTDGIDGLSTSVTTIILACLTVIGIIFDVKEIVVFGASLIGICLAFLLFNLHPAKVFMGDTGSLLLGGAVSVMAIYLKMPILLIIIAIIPVLETLSDIIQVTHYKRTGKRVFKMAPLHHHFELCGWNENAIVSVFSIITLIACMIGLIAI